MALRRLGLFGRVFLLFVLICILPALALLIWSSRGIDQVIRRQSRSESRVMSLVNSAHRAVRGAAAGALRLPEELGGFLAKLGSRPKPPESTVEQFQADYQDRVREHLDRLVSAAEMPRLNPEQKAVVADLLALMDPDPKRARPPEDRTLRVLQTCFPPLDDYRLGSPELFAAERARLSAGPWLYEELADTTNYVGDVLPLCNFVFLLDENGKVATVRRPDSTPAAIDRLGRRPAYHNRITRYGVELPENFGGKALNELPPAGPHREPASALLTDMLKQVKAEVARRGQPAAGATLSTEPGGVQVVCDSVQGLDLLGQFTDPADYRSRSMVVLSTLHPALAPQEDVKYVLFLINWSVIQAAIVGDQAYKRSRNIDTLRMTAFDRDQAGDPRCIAGGVPEFLGRPVRPADPLFGPVFADDLRAWTATPHDASPAGRPARLFDFTAGSPFPPADMMGGVRVMEPPAEPPRWPTVFAFPAGAPGKRPFDWSISVFYDLDEGSVVPLVRTQVLILSGMLLTVMLAACWIVARMISKPVRALREMTAELAAGKYSPEGAADAPRASRSWSAPREIHELDRAFREMAAQVVTKHSLQEKNKTLEDTILRLNNTQQELQVSNMLASLGVISGEYAHAVNNGLQLPLATLQQLESMLGSLNLPENVREDIPASVESLKHTAGFVSQFRDFARTDNTSLTTLNLNAVVESVALNWKPQLRRRQIDLEIEPGKPPPVWGNDSMLMHVLLNLLLNSRDAIRERRKKNPEQRGMVGKIRLATTNENGSAVLSITDNGCGIPPDIAPRIFQAMFTTKAKGEGSGLGLSSVLRAVRRHGGEIWFESDVNKGTTFFIRFPPHDQAEKMLGPGKKTSSSGLRPPVLDIQDPKSLPRVPADPDSTG